MQCMGFAEVTHRIGDLVTATLQSKGIGLAKYPAQPDEFKPIDNWIKGHYKSTGEGNCAYAEQVIEGRIPIFSIDNINAGGVVNWNKDYKSSVVAPVRFGKTLNYRDEKLVGDIKYLWEPNRHLQLVCVAQAYVITGNKKYLVAIRNQLQSWLEQCPYPLGANWTSSLELGIRLINWSIIWQLIGGHTSPIFDDDSGEQFRNDWMKSVYQHCHFISGHRSAHSSANNHLIGEAAGLFIAALTWPYWIDSAKWADTAQRILTLEAEKQNYSDGVNCEQAISYQQFVFDFLLFSGLAARAAKRDFDGSYWSVLEKMLEFVASIMDVGGNVPMFGDADDGYVTRLSQESGFCPYKSMLATGAVLFNRDDFKQKSGYFDDKSAWLLGEEGQKSYASLASKNHLHQRASAFTEGGYYLLGSNFGKASEIKMVVDSGALGYLSIAAHGHADALSVVLSMSGQEFLIDPGTYAYHTQKKWRDYFRGTSAHNTLRVDGVDQSVSGGNFMWIKHAPAQCVLWETRAEQQTFVGRHFGYSRLKDPVVHTRAIHFDGVGVFEFVDTLACMASHSIERYWHFSEYCDVSVVANGVIRARIGNEQIIIEPHGQVESHLFKGDEREPLGWISRRYDNKMPTSTIVWRNSITGTSELKARINCFTNNDIKSVNIGEN